MQGKLYLGDQFDANDLTIMRNLKITHVVNVTSEIPNHFENEGNFFAAVSNPKNIGIKYIRIVVEDKNESKIHYYFPRVYGFIDSAIFTEDRTAAAAGLSVQNVFDYKRALYDKDNSFKSAKELFVCGLRSLMQKTETVTTSKSPEEISEQFDEMLKVCPNNNKNRILVHCAMGISRSSSIVIMYLMKKFGISFESVFPLSFTSS